MRSIWAASHKNPVTLTESWKNNLYSLGCLGSEFILYWTFCMFGQGQKKRAVSAKVSVMYVTLFPDVWEIYFVHKRSKELNLIFLLSEELLDSPETYIIARKHWWSRFSLTWPLKWLLNHSSLPAQIHFLKECMLQRYHVIMMWATSHDVFWLWITRETMTVFTLRSKSLQKIAGNTDEKTVLNLGGGVESTSLLYLSGWIILNEHFSPHVPRLITVYWKLPNHLLCSRRWLGRNLISPPIVSKALANTLL